jgi:ribosomal protein S12 methylthiotransferase accessory factor
MVGVLRVKFRFQIDGGLLNRFKKKSQRGRQNMRINPAWLPAWTPAPNPKKTLDFDSGLVLRWFNFPPYHDEPKLWHFSATLKVSDVETGIDPDDGDSGEFAGGSSLDIDRALAKLAGESVERYATTRNSHSELQKLNSWNELVASGFMALDPVELPISDESQRDYRRNEQVSWLKGVDLRSIEPAFVPAQLVFVPHVFLEHEAVWRAPISTGAASHSTIEGALYAGLCEVIERDAFQVAWLRQLKLSRLEPPTGETNAHSLLERLLEVNNRYHLRCEIYQLPCSLPLTVCMAIVWDDTGMGPPCAVAAKCSPSKVIACLGAIEEAHQMRSWLRRLLDTSGACSRAEKKLNTLRDRARHWLTPEAAKTLKDWVQYASSVAPNNSLEESHSLTLAELINEVVRDGGSPYAVDLSDRLPESMRQLGWKVVKVVVPQYQPLNLTEEMEDFALIRLNNAEFRLGVEAAIPSQQIFQHPHPFL